MKSITRRVGILIAVLLVAGALTSCGDDEGETTTTAAETTTTEAVASELTIMVASPLTGDWADLGRDLANGAELGAVYVNENGGVQSGPLAGATVAIVQVDDKGTTEGAVTAASQYVSDPNVFILMGFIDSGMAAAAGAAAAREGLAGLGTYVGADFLTTENDNIIPMGTSLAVGAGSAVAFAASLGYQRIGVIGYDIALVDSCIPGIQAAVEDLGLELVADERFSPGMADFSVLIENLRGADAEMLLIGAADADAARFLTQLRQAEYDVPIVDFIAAGWRETFSEAAGDALTSGAPVYSMDPGLVFDAVPTDSVWTEWFDRYEEQYGRRMTVAAQWAFDSVLTIVAIAEAGAGTREEVMDYVTEATGEGISGPIAFTSEPRPVSRMSVFAQYTGTGLNDREVVAVFSNSTEGYVQQPWPPG